jgi:hypothetical protein
MYVFRESHRVAPAGRLLTELAEAVSRAGSSHQQDEVQDALLRAGELECALADSGHQAAAAAVAGVTDCLASALVCGDRLAMPQSCLQILRAISVSGELMLKVPEGFAYYCLHPLDYARAIEQQLSGMSRMSGVAVIGIRTIGTTLGAVVAAELRRHRIAASRITVRPHGHPFRRECRFNNEQREWAAERRQSSDSFLIVDEGPGLSGSSFLSVATALQVEGVDPQEITFLCSRVPDVSSFCSETSRAEWPLFRSFAAGSFLPQFEEHIELSCGHWREQLFAGEDEWPAAWANMERKKFLTSEGSALLRFEGLGKYGEAAFNRALALAEAGFGPPVLARENGFTRYSWVEGERMRAGDLDEKMVERIAQYCAFRAAEFRCDESSRGAVNLETMARVNLKEEFGDDCGIDLGLLAGTQKTISDSRMVPHAWLRTPNGTVLKTDGGLHGDDHFFPGPCDIAWDLAGAIVEWEMGECVAKHFLSKYFDLTGDDARARIEGYVIAYTAFRMGYCKMGAEGMAGSGEGARLRRDFLKYRQFLAQRLRNSGSTRVLADASVAQPRSAVPHTQAA